MLYEVITKLPEGFKDFCAKVSIETSSIQYENDDIMRSRWGDDYGIACCVSAMRIGKQMQFFGARANLAKALLYAINGGVDEKSGVKVAEGFEPIKGDVLSYEEVMAKLDPMMDWLAKTYVKALNAIHYMHDKYAYERIEMALHDRDILRTMACGIAGLSVAADSLSAIKHAKVRIVRNAEGLAVDYAIKGEYPAYGNNDDRADGIAVWLTETFMKKVASQPYFYRNAMPTQSVLTITSNVVYGKKTGNTPDGRRAGEPFSPGANPMNGRDKRGFVAAGASVAKLPYASALDGISWTASATPDALGRSGRRAREQPGEVPRRLHGCGRSPCERERVQSRDARRCDGASGEVPATDGACLRLCGELRQADARTATRRDFAHVPRIAVIR